MSNVSEEGQAWLFEPPDSDRAPHTLHDAHSTENRFREAVIERLQRIEKLIERLLKQVENRM